MSNNENTPEVPDRLREAYDRAKPDPWAFTDEAARQLAVERNPGASLITADMHGEVLRDAASIFERAVHLSKLRQAIAEVDIAAAQAATRADYESRNTCPLCREVSSEMRTLNGKRACPKCVSVSEAILTELHRTKDRERAVRAALGL